MSCNPLWPLGDFNEGMPELPGPELGMDWGLPTEEDEREF